MSIVNKGLIKTSLVARLVRKTLLATGNKIWQYNFDGIDDYIQLPTIPLFTGDVVEFDFVPNLINDGLIHMFLYGSTNSVSGRAFIFSDNTLGFTNYAAMELDDVPITTLTTISPTDGETHHIKLVASASTVDLAYVGSSPIVSGLLNNVIKNLRITRVNPTDQYPDLFWPISDGFNNNPIIRQTIPHNHKTDGTEMFDSVTATWRDYIKPEYRFDGIDDYIQVPSVPIFIGDKLTVELVMDKVQADIAIPIGDVATGNIIFRNTGVLEFSPRTDNLLDGKPFTSGDTHPVDDRVHTIELTYTANDTLTYIGGRATEFNYDGIIKHVKLIRANPTSQYPDLHWPILDDFTSNPTIVQVLPSSTNYDGTAYNFNSARWSEPTYQYDGVVGYHRLADRALLSGLSTNLEAAATCKEGRVKNGDFRFGNNGVWDFNSSLYNISNGRCNFNNLTTFESLTQEDVFTVGVTYVISFDVESTENFGLADGAGNLIAVGTSGTVSIKWVADTTQIAFKRSISGATGWIDNIRVQRSKQEQVKTRYVNHGEAINFNQENWENV